MRRYLGQAPTAEAGAREETGLRSCFAIWGVGRRASFRCLRSATARDTSDDHNIDY
jgi:hypothetical protein